MRCIDKSAGKNGAVAGCCCADIMTPIWHVGYLKHLNERIKLPSEHVEDTFR